VVPVGVVPELPAVGAIRLAFYRVFCLPGPLGCGSKEVREHDPPESEVPVLTLTSRAIAREGQMGVVIGVDPHKGSHAAVAIDANEQQLAKTRVRSGPRQLEQLLAWAAGFGERTWAVESAGGLGYLLAQQLLGAGEWVLDVPATLA
jgi:hypothetical protein